MTVGAVRRKRPLLQFNAGSTLPLFLSSLQEG